MRKSSQSAPQNSALKRMRSFAEQQLVDLLQEIELLLKELDTFQKTIASNPPTWLLPLRKSLTAFHQFSFDYFTFIQLDNPNNLADQRRALRKIQHEILSLRLLVEQRLAKSEATEFLQLADRLANELVVSSGLTWEKNLENNLWTRLYRKPDPFLVFFEDVHFIRQGFASYDRVPSVALPLSVWRSPWSWMGMAHEIGHYVYQNLSRKLNDATSPLAFKDGLEERLLDALTANIHSAAVRQTKVARIRALPLWQAWNEEVFADVFGALILGPSYIESLIAWLYPSANSLESLFKNDHDHPVMFLRPLIQLEALRAINSTSAKKSRKRDKRTTLLQALPLIENEWYQLSAELIAEDKPAGNQALRAFLHKQRVEQSTVTIADLLADVPLVVNAVLDALQLDQSGGGYSSQNHDRVEKTTENLIEKVNAQTDLQDAPSSDSVLSDLPLSLVLPVAWYVHEAILDEPAKLDALTQVIKKIVIPDSAGDKQKGNHSSVQVTVKGDFQSDTGPSVQQLLKKRVDQRQQGEAFKKLVDDLTQQLNNNDKRTGKGCRLCNLLLDIQFSSQDNFECCSSSQTCCARPV
jgi:hypothetical protein